MAIPDYCDERAEKYFERGFVGSSSGENGTPYKYHWNSTSGAKETKMVVFGYQEHICAYCGNKGFPLQPRFKGSFSRDSDSTVTGYACVCKDAMDEVEIKEKLQILKAKHHAEEALLANRLPQVSKKVLKDVVNLKAKNLKEDIDRSFCYEHNLSELNINIKG